MDISHVPVCPVGQSFITMYILPLCRAIYRGVMWDLPVLRQISRAMRHNDHIGKNFRKITVSANSKSSDDAHYATPTQTMPLPSSLRHSHPHYALSTLTTPLPPSLRPFHPHYATPILTTPLPPSLRPFHPHYATPNLTTPLHPSLRHSHPHYAPSILTMKVLILLYIKDWMKVLI